MRIERILDWAAVHGYREGENPARWKGHLEHILPAQGKIAPVEHHDALPHAEVPAFIAELQGRNGSAGAFEFLILTAARTGEVLGATWDEFDCETRIWTIPAVRMKAAREHRVPLADRAIEILKDQPHTGKQPFPYSNMAFLQTLKRMDRDGVTAHGFRSSFPGLGGRDRRGQSRRCGNGAGACDRRQDRSGLSARRSIRQAAQADGRLGGLLRGRRQWLSIRSSRLR